MMLQSSLAQIHQFRLSTCPLELKKLSLDHTLRFMHSSKDSTEQVTTPVSVRIRPFVLTDSPGSIGSDSISASFAEFDALFHPLMNGFRGSGRVAFPAFKQAPSTPGTSPTLSQTPSHLSSTISPRSDLYLLTGRLIPAGPHDAILDDVVPIILLNQRLRASLFRKYYAQSSKSLKQSKRPPINHQAPFIPATSVLRESSLDPLVLNQQQQLQYASSSTTTGTSSSSSKFLLPDLNLTHVPPPLALSFGSSGVLIPPNSEFVALSTSDPSKKARSSNKQTSSSSKTSSNRSLDVHQFMPAIGHGSGLAGYMSPSDFVDASMMSQQRTEQLASTSSVSSSASQQRLSPQPDAHLDSAKKVAASHKSSCGSKRKHDELGPKTYVCMDCGTNTSPEWRRGPTGEKCLCNACGLRFAKRKKLEREAATCTNALPPLQVLLPTDNPDLTQVNGISTVSLPEVSSLPNQMQISPIVTTTTSTKPKNVYIPLPNKPRPYIHSYNSTPTNLMMPRYQQVSVQQQHQHQLPIQQPQIVHQPEWTDLYRQDAFRAPSSESVASLPSLVDLIRPVQQSSPRSVSVSTRCDDNTIVEEKSRSGSVNPTDSQQVQALDAWWSSSLLQQQPPELPSGSSLPPRYYCSVPTSPLFASNPATIVQQQQSTTSSIPVASYPHFNHAGYLPTLHEQHVPAQTNTIPSTIHSQTSGSVQSCQSIDGQSELLNTQGMPGLPLDTTVGGSNPLLAFTSRNVSPPPPPKLPVHQTPFTFPNATTPSPAQTKNSIQYLQNLNALNKEKQLDAKQRLAKKPSSASKPKRVKKPKLSSSSSTKHPQSLIQQAQTNLASLNNALISRQDSVLGVNRGGSASSVCSASSASSRISSTKSDFSRASGVQQDFLLRYQQVPSSVVNNNSNSPVQPKPAN